MSALTVGGAQVVSASLTYAWGGSPASGSVSAKGTCSIGADDSVALTVGGSSFFGKVVGDPVAVTDSEGSTVQLSIVDNRELLKEDYVTCRFNRVVIRADNPDTPEIDRWRRYEHIYPDDWGIQKTTVTDAPHTAKEIIQKLFDAPTVNHSWTGVFHPDQDKAMREVDANRGKSLVNVLTEITSAQGLIMTLVGSSQLKWGRKGEDTAPSASGAGVFDITTGNSLNSNATRVLIVGDPNRYQELFIDLESDWLSKWEDYWIEPDFLDAINDFYGPFPATDAGRAELAAKARTVTVQEFADAFDEPAELADDRKFHGVSRLSLPAWVYLTEIVWKAYAVPTSYTLNGVPLADLTLSDGLLIDVQGNVDNGEITVKTDPAEEFYPSRAAFFMAQGQQIGILDPSTQRTLTQEQVEAARLLWSEVKEFTLDPESDCVYFKNAVFVPGAVEADKGLFVFPNRVEDMDIDEEHALYNICAPNVNVEASPAPVRACLVFECELYSQEYGSGRRSAAEYVSGLSLHSIMQEGVNVREITYKGDVTAGTKAAEYAHGKITNQVTYAYGGFSRKGSAGTALNSSTDRITVTYGAGGLTERVEYAKERGPSDFIPEAELERREQSKDLYPGERALREEVRTFEAKAAILRATAAEEAARKAAPYRHAASVMAIPVGAPGPEEIVKLANATARKAGEVVWMDAAGLENSAGLVFGGVVVAEGAAVRAAVARQGTVPVRVQGPFVEGDAVGGDGGGVVVGGTRPVGTVQFAYDGDKEVLVPVRLGGVASAPRRLFQIYDASVRDAAGEITTARVKVVSSLLAQDVPTAGIAAGIDVANGHKVYAHVAFNTTTGEVTGRTIEAAAEVPDESSGNAYLRIGVVTISGRVLTALNDVYGPIEGCRRWFASPLAYDLHGTGE